MIATIFDGMTRHTPEGFAFKARCEEVGFKQAVRERDSGELCRGPHVARTGDIPADGFCACGSSGAAVCGAGRVMAWERGRGEGARGRGER
jgi:hypothetical protein